MSRLALTLLFVATTTFAADPTPPAHSWQVATPIVSYWAGPGFPGGAPLNDAEAQKLVDGGWNLAWASEKELPVAAQHHLRAILTDPLLDPAALDDPKRAAALGALIDRVKTQPALYAYHLTDEPSAAAFPALGKLVAYLRERDPAHLAYINLFPTYASNQQLGVAGSPVEAYREYLRQFIQTVKPGLLSYDHYQFTRGGDNPDYFLNLGLVRQAALDHHLPFMNIVQACTWTPGATASGSPRIPDAAELRYLTYTTLAYGAQAISHYVYGYPGHEGGMIRYAAFQKPAANPETPDLPTPLYDAAKSLNREFAAIAKELQPLSSTGVFHAGMLPPGAVELPADSPVTFDPPIPKIPYKPGERVRGFILSQFSPTPAAAPTHFVVVNLDYKTEAAITLKALGPLETFDAAAKQWSPAGGARIDLHLPGGGGKLLRLSPAK